MPGAGGWCILERVKLINGLKNRKTYWLFALLCAALWGSATVGIKLAYGVFPIAPDDTASQLLMIGVRFTLAGVITELIFSLADRKPLLPQNRAACGHALVLSFTQVILLYALYSMGAANASGSAAVMINGTSTFFTILFATFIFRTERMDLRKAFACVLGFAAVYFMSRNGSGSPFTFRLTGEGALLLSQCLAGLSHNITKRYTVTDDPAMLSAWQFFFGGLVLTAVGLCMGGRLSASVAGWALIVYLAFVSGVAFSVWGLLMKYHPVSRINIFMLANPLFGLLFSWVLLGEKAQVFRFQTLLALLLISGGILLVNLPKARRGK